MNLRVAVAQTDAAIGDVERNIRTHVRLTEKAVSAGAGFIVFPELSLTGYSVKDLSRDLAVTAEHPPAVMQPLIDLSGSISILAGGIEIDPSHRIHNAAFLFENGRMVCAHRKVYLPTYGMFEEMRYFSPGRSVRPVHSRHGVIGVLICEDLWHVPLPYLLVQQGASLLVAMAASPTRLSGNGPDLGVAAANRENHCAYARLLSSYVVFCNRVGFEDGMSFWGGSEIIGPGGEMLCSARNFEEDLIIAEVDSNEVRRARSFSRHMLDDDPLLTSAELRRILEGRS
jgi:predicted amidohydrolase